MYVNADYWHCGHGMIELVTISAYFYLFFYFILFYSTSNIAFECTIQNIYTKMKICWTMCIVTFNVSMWSIVGYSFCHFPWFLCTMRASFEILSIEKAIVGTNGCICVLDIFFLIVHHWVFIYKAFRFCSHFGSEIDVIVTKVIRFMFHFGKIWFFSPFLRIQN